MKVLSITSKVDLGNNLKGTILEILIGPSHQVQYKVLWWDGKERKTDWLYETEVEGKYTDRIEIGFHNE